jgi:tetratricopeptide (TPR) repeat protein
LASFRKIYGFVTLLTLLVLWQSCTTEKNTWITRKFHTTCAHYNGYFWGKLSYEEGLDKLAITHKEDYADILSVYAYAENTEVQAIFPQMDRTIKKCQTMIENHTITDKAHHEIADACKYTKYCYMLMAQANLYKNEYITSLDELDYASREYKKTDVKYNAMIWQIRAYDQMGAVSKSEELIDYLESNTSVPKKVLPEMYAAFADYYSRIGEYANVAKYLKKAIAIERKKRVKARYYFILGQITSRMGDNELAYAYYGKVLKSDPTPDLDFEATIYRAMLFMGGEKENEKVKKELTKMLKPTKYVDQRDQIYYALAQISIKEGDTTQGVVYLNKSIRASTTNARQKAVSYLQLANYNFNWEEYVRSKKYFDSTLTSLPKNYRGRDSIVAKKENLQKLVTYLDIIAYQDSVQRLAKMSKSDLDKYINGVIDQEKEAEANKKKKDQDAQSLQANTNTNQNTTAAANGKWYFYNPAAQQQGINEFNQKWGNRPLEDDWRRSHKVANANKIGQEGDQGKGNDSNKTAKTKNGKDSTNNKYSEAYYLKHIPLTDAAMKKSVDSVIDAYYNAGAIYKEYLHNYKKSSFEFEELLSRFPDNKYKLLVYYELYRIYQDVGNEERMNYYKDLLLTKYPDTQYAMLIKDPEQYEKNKEASEQEVVNLYTATMHSYTTENYLEVLNDCKKADSLYPQNDLTPKFAFLKAVATGSTEGIEAYKNALTRVTIQYPKDSVRFLAQSILDYLNRKPVMTAKDSNSIIYSPATDSVYFWILLVDAKEATKMSKVVADITDMDNKTFSQDALTSDEIFLNTNQLMVVIKKFTSIDKVKNYYLFTSTTDMFNTLSPGAYQLFYISQKNFRLMFNHKKADEYLQYFREKS